MPSNNDNEPTSERYPFLKKKCDYPFEEALLPQFILLTGLTNEVLRQDSEEGAGTGAGIVKGCEIRVFVGLTYDEGRLGNTKGQGHLLYLWPSLLANSHASCKSQLRDHLLQEGFLDTSAPSPPGRVRCPSVGSHSSLLGPDKEP